MGTFPKAPHHKRLHRRLAESRETIEPFHQLIDPRDPRGEMALQPDSVYRRSLLDQVLNGRSVVVLVRFVVAFQDVEVVAYSFAIGSPARAARNQSTIVCRPRMSMKS
jgi:hypothetical protein